MKEIADAFFVRGSGLSDCAAVSRSRAINYLRKRENFRNSRKISVGHRAQRFIPCRAPTGAKQQHATFYSARMIYLAQCACDANFCKKRVLY